MESQIKKLVYGGDTIKCGFGYATFYIRSDSQ